MRKPESLLSKKRPILGRTGLVRQLKTFNKISLNLAIPIIAIIMPRMIRTITIVVIMVIMPSRSANFSVTTRIESRYTRQQNKIESQNYFFHLKPPANFWRTYRHPPFIFVSGLNKARKVPAGKIQNA